MKRLQLAFMLVIVLAWTAPAHAQLFFGKKPKPNPNQRVPELIVIAKTDADERKRASAAEELRDYDPVVFTEIVPVLIDVLQHDKKVNVRAEALTSLAKLRPVTTAAGRAIEKAAAEDDALRVRMQAKAALPKYHLAGYVSKSSPASTPSAPVAAKKQTNEPPLATQQPPPAKIVALPAPPSAKVVVQPAPRPVDPAPTVDPVPANPPIPRPFPPVATPPAKTPPPGDGPSLFP